MKLIIPCEYTDAYIQGLFIIILMNCMGVTNTSILNCPNANNNNNNNGKYLNFEENTGLWPVRARIKPLIEKPEAILDMPHLNESNTDSYRLLIDWGKNGQISTIFDREVFIWSEKDGVLNSGTLTHTETSETIIDCLKWNPTGTEFAVCRFGLEDAEPYYFVSVFKSPSLKAIWTLCCKNIHSNHEGICRITALEYTKDGNLLIGCSQGTIAFYARNKQYCCINYHVVNSEIRELKLSCKDNYLLVVMDTEIGVYKWPPTGNEPALLLLKNGILTKAIVWHPWKQGILAVGKFNKLVSIYDVNIGKRIGHKKISPFFKNYQSNNCHLDYITFCPYSGELVGSFYYRKHGNVNSIITVFKDFNTIVDEFTFHIGRVPHIIWNGDGRKMATLGSDENLVIWNFFGPNGNKEKHRYKIRLNNNLTLNFHACIR